MTNILYEMLVERYPSSDGVDKVFGYPPPSGLERISVSFRGMGFRPKRNLITIADIKDIARIVFDDIEWEFSEKAGDYENILTFDSTKTYKSAMNRDLEYVQSYDNHFVTFTSPFFFPSMEMALGWRGTSRLHQRQRAKYFALVNNIYSRFVQKSKSEKIT